MQRRPVLKFRRRRPIEPGETVHEELRMGLDVAPIGTPSFSTAPDRAPRGSRAAVERDAADVSSNEIPASPPPEVLEAMDAAGRVARELHEQGRELRFVPSAEGADERVRIEVRDLDGNVLRTIPPSELLDVATGSPLD
jgi:hypothetical protein